MKNIWFALVMACYCAVSFAQDDTMRFPKTIKYKMSKDGKVMADCILAFAKDTRYSHSSSISLLNFKGFGFSSDDKIYTYFNKETLALYVHLLMKGNTKAYEIFLKKGGIMDKDATTYVFEDYRDGAAGKTQGTELYSKLTAIDLLSSYYVASAKVASGTFTKPIGFDMFFEERVRPVMMVPKGTMNLDQAGEKMEVQIVSVAYGEEELYRFLITTDEQGYTYPLRVIFDSKEKGRLELIASKIER